LIESRHGQLHGATHIQNEQGRDISTGWALPSPTASPGVYHAAILFIF
jgi:hypothetical protein